MSSQASHVLRLSQFAESDADTFHIELTLDGSNVVRTPPFKIGVTPQDSEDLRWYLEDYLQYPLDPAPQKAVRVEQRMRDIGIELFKNVLYSNKPVEYMWARLMPDLSNTRIEIATECDSVGTDARSRNG
jgi:hypothetical protein